MQTLKYHNCYRLPIKFQVLTGYLLLFFFLLSLAACGRGESNVDSGNRDGIFHYGNGAEPQTVDPHISTGVPESNIIYSLFEGLVHKNAKTLEIEPAVAESWTVSEDGKTYTFIIRENAQWSNGDRLTARDFEWSWWRALQPALGNQYVSMLYPIVGAKDYFEGKVTDFNKVGIKALSDNKFQVRLKNSTPYFLQILDLPSTFPVHRPTIEKWGEPDESYTRWTRPENFVANGPFMLDTWRLNKILTVRKNKFYWGADKVKLNGINYYPVDSLVTEERMFRAGQLHYTQETIPERKEWYEENLPRTLIVNPYAGTYFYRINTKLAHLSDERVRKALAMSIDRELLIRSVLKDIPIPSYSMTPPGLLNYKAPIEFSYNPAAARRLLTEAGYANGEGFPEFEIQFNTSESHRKIAVVIQQMWKKELGINVTLQNKDWKVYLDDTQTFNYDVSRSGWIGDYVDPNTFLEMWSTGNSLNKTGWGSTEYDDLVLNQAPKANNREERFNLLKKAESILINAMPIIPIYTYSSHHYIHPSVQGIENNIMNYKDFRSIYLDPSKKLDKLSKGLQ